MRRQHAMSMPAGVKSCDTTGWLPHAIRQLGTDRSGGAAVTFCMVLVPLLGFAGFALDYARVSLARVDLQAAVDSAGLAIALLPRTTPIKDVQQRALDRVNASLAGKGLGRITLEATRTGTNISFSASSSVDLTLFKILRKEPVALNASNEVSWDLGRVEVALVLDNTGSMVDNNSPKLANLKTAAKSLVGQLQQAATNPNQVKIGIVPFSMTVNVGPGYATAPWVDQNAKSPINKEIFYNANPNRFALLQQMGVAWGGCVESRPSPYDVQDTAPDSLAPETLYVPFFAPDEPDTGTYYNNYLSDGAQSNWTERRRQGNVAKYNTKKLKTGTDSWSKYKYGPNAGCSMQPLLRLTTDMNAATTKIDSLNAAGDTNISLGLMWGWHVLSPSSPFSDGSAYDTPDLTKFIILMTDGDNRNTATNNSNASLYSGIGYIWQGRLGITAGSDLQRQTAMDDRLSALCTNIKAKGVQIFTVRVEVNSGSSTLLERCASRADMFYNVENSSDLTAIFGQIGDKISQLRLSK